MLTDVYIMRNCGTLYILRLVATFTTKKNEMLTFSSLSLFFVVTDRKKTIWNV